MTTKHTTKAMSELIRDGAIRATGELRGGQLVYVATRVARERDELLAMLRKIVEGHSARFDKPNQPEWYAHACAAIAKAE